MPAFYSPLLAYDEFSTCDNVTMSRRCAQSKDNIVRAPSSTIIAAMLTSTTPLNYGIVENLDLD